MAQWTFAPARADGQPIASVIKTAFVPTTVPDTISSIKGNKNYPEPKGVQASPRYPKTFAGRPIGSGEVVVSFYVNKQGKTEDITVVSSTHWAFEEPAIGAIKQWRFKPAMVDGVPIRTRMQIPIAFDLSDND